MLFTKVDRTLVAQQITSWVRSIAGGQWATVTWRLALQWQQPSPERLGSSGLMHRNCRKTEAGQQLQAAAAAGSGGEVIRGARVQLTSSCNCHAGCRTSVPRLTTQAKTAKLTTSTLEIAPTQQKSQNLDSFSALGVHLQLFLVHLDRHFFSTMGVHVHPWLRLCVFTATYVNLLTFS